jgi:hypothetical protein
MSASIVSEPDTCFGDDVEHPIPFMNVIDVNTVKAGGGSDLFIVIAKPLRGDHRSLKRLLRKVEKYLEFLNSDMFRRESGAPTAANTKIIVKLHPDSDVAAFELLEKNKQWVINNNATLLIDTNLPRLIS